MSMKHLYHVIGIISTPHGERRHSKMSGERATTWSAHILKIRYTMRTHESHINTLAKFLYYPNSMCKYMRKNNWYFGSCPVLPLLRLLWYLVGPYLVCWDDWPSCEESMVSLVICLSSWFVSISVRHHRFNKKNKERFVLGSIVSKFKRGWIDLLKVLRIIRFYHSTQKINRFIWQWTDLFWQCLCLKMFISAKLILRLYRLICKSHTHWY